MEQQLHCSFLASLSPKDFQDLEVSLLAQLILIFPSGKLLMMEDMHAHNKGKTFCRRNACGRMQVGVYCEV